MQGMIEKIMEDAMKHAQSPQRGEPFVYGFSMRVGPDGKPIISEFGNRPQKPVGGKPVLSEEREPVTEVIEEEKQLAVTLELPGVDKKDIDVEAEKGVLTIKGERRSEKKSGDATYERVERVSGKFLRRFTLPENAQADAISAKQTNGVLEVTIPKQPQVQPKRIEVQAA